MSESRFLKIFRSIFFIAGLGLLAGTFWSVYSTRSFIAEALRADGVVIDLERSRSSDGTTYSPVVRFIAADGVERTFVTSWSSSPPSHSRGEAVQVLYPAERPEEAEVEGFLSLWGGALITGLLGTAFFLVGGGMIAFDLYFRRRRRMLQQTGRLILADFTGVERNETFEYDGRHPWRILCQWQDTVTGKVHVFASENIWYDPTDYVTEKQLGVRIDPKNPKRYWVDTSSLPEAA